MANRERGELRLVAQDRTYTLRLTTGACCELEDRTGQTLAAVIEGVNAGRATATRWLGWAALQARHGDEVCTVEAAGDVLTAAGGFEVVRPVLSAFMALNADDDTSEDGTGTEPVEDTRPGSQWRRLYLDARAGGMAPETFWSLSLRELWLELAATRQRQKQDRERDLSMAWWVASLSRQQRLPALTTILGRQARQRRTKPQTWQEMKAALMALTADSGKETKHGRR